jgi:formate hydrogenlyase subunit 3/multisubunit Na+/H+ antiporter MnhD subunit
VSSTTGSSQRSTGRTVLAVILGIIAVLFVVAGVLYLTESAGSLSILPGHIAGSTGHHPLRATGCFVGAIIFAVGAWFTLVYKPKPQAAAQSDRESSPAGRN